MEKNWYSIKALKDDEYEVAIYDEIGFWGVTAKDFRDDFKKIPANASVYLRINSPGGDVFDGNAIANMIRRHEGKVTATVDGLAASMASVIALSADKVIMPENSYLMIHNPWGISFGDADEMRDYADLLDKMKAGIVNTYANKSGKSIAEISVMMDDETWLNGKEALEQGFADELAAPVKVSARFVMLGKFTRTPAPLKDFAQEVATSVVNDAQEIVSLCTTAGVRDLASDFILDGLTLEEVRRRLADADAIRSACVAIDLPDGKPGALKRAAGFIRAGAGIDLVRAQLNKLKVAFDSEEVNNTFRPNSTAVKPTEAVVIDYKEIYARRRAK